MRAHRNSRRGRPAPSRLLRPVVGLTAMALTLAACASLGDGAGSGLVTGSGSGSGGDTQAPLLQMTQAGGFVPMGYDFGHVPDLTVYADGRAITYGPQIEIWPAPALPNLVVTHLGDDDVASLIDAARDAGLLTEAPDYGHPPVADVPTTTVTLTVDGQTYVHAAEALGVADGTAVDSGDASTDLSQAQVDARLALSGFLTDVRELVDGSADQQPYDITAFAVMAQPAVAATVPDDTLAEPEPGVEPELERQVVPWPLDVSLADATTCVVVAGEDARTLRTTLQGANQASLYEQDGVQYDAFFRPLLPHESTCDDIA